MHKPQVTHGTYNDKYIYALMYTSSLQPGGCQSSAITSLVLSPLVAVAAAMKIDSHYILILT